MQHTQAPALWAAAILLTLSPVAAFSDTFVTIQGSAGTAGGVDPPKSFILSDAHTAALSINYSSQLLNPPEPPISISAGAGATAYADYGVIQAAVAGRVDQSNAESSAAATYTDTFLITSNRAVSFEQLSLVPKWYLDQSSLIANDAAISIGYSTSIGTGTTSSRMDLSTIANSAYRYDFATVVTSDQNGSTVTDLLNQGPLYELPAIEVFFGQPITVSALLGLSGSTSATKINPTDGGFYDGAYLIDATHSAYWGGLTLIDPNGVAFTDFTVTSVSGTDWSKSFIPSAVPEPPTSVPEPPTSVLLLLGLGLLFAGKSLAQRQSKEDKSAGCVQPASL